jgi:hypothetical protein
VRYDPDVEALFAQAGDGHSTEPMEATLKGLDDERFALWRVALGATIGVPRIPANR